MNSDTKYSNLNHLAIIPDGNRRWAKAHLLLPWLGHVEGIKRFWEIADYGSDKEITNLTFWAGSYNNLKDRNKDEVDALFKLLTKELSEPKLLKRLAETHTSLAVIGEWEVFARDNNLKQTLLEVEEKTKQYSEHHVTILFGYDGQREMLGAVKKLQQSGEEATKENVQKYLLTAALPDVDFVIRTGGEPHWSAGFLMWQTANSQFYFTEDLWPDFKVPQLKKALEDFERRERRLGK